jgi:hypothetical protein
MNDISLDTGLEPVLVTFRHVYGLIKCYPANDQAKVLARIAGTKTLLPETLAGARALGLRLEVEAGNSAELLGNFLATGRLS